MTSTPPEAPARRLLKSPFDLAAGLFLIGLAVLGLVGGSTLPSGTLSSMGSGLVPRAVSILVGAFGVFFVVKALILEGEHPLERWHVRGPAFVLGSVLVFAMLIRGATLSFGGFAGIPLLFSFDIPSLGLIVAGPAAVIVSSFASRDTRPVEIAVFSVTMTLACGLLFKEFLNLPIPFDPQGIVPEAVNSVYEGAKAAIAYVVGVVVSLFVG